MTAWTLSQDERRAVVERLADNISRVGFFRGTPIADDICLKLAGSIERKAFTAAEVASKTTTGDRPKAEGTRSYARKLGQLVIDAIRDGALVTEDDSESLAVGVGGAVLDLSGGKREFLDKESAEKTLAVMLADGAVITKIRFSQKSFGLEAAEVAKRGIQNVSASLSDADISDVIAGRPEDEALKSLSILSEGLASCRLRALNLSDNALGEKGIRACQAALVSQSGLESLTLENVGCSVHACKALAELLPNPGGLKRLHLFNNMSGDEGALHISTILAKAAAIEDFKMVYSRVGAQGGLDLAKGLSAGTSLIRLDLSGNPMTPDYAKALGDVLKTQRNLRYLNLNDTLLGDTGVEHVAIALAHSAPHLEELELATNEITEKGARPIARCLMGKPSLQRLNLSENELKDAGVKTVCGALSSNDELKALDLRENMIRGPGAIAAANAVAGRKGFSVLALNGNWMTAEAIEAVRAIVGKGDAGEEAMGSLSDNDSEGFSESEDESEDELEQAVAKAKI